MKTILLMEDNPYDARLIIRLLEILGYRMLHATEANAGLQMAMQERPDLILLDMGLPDLDGQTVAALIKMLPELTDVPVVVVTAWPPDTARQMAEAYGCAGFISKPINVKDFALQVTAFFKDSSGKQAVGRE